MSRPSCNSPLACTSYASLAPLALSTRRDTLVSASCINRSPILVPVRCVPPRPARGESLGENIMLRPCMPMSQSHMGFVALSTAHEGLPGTEGRRLKCPPECWGVNGARS